MSIPVRYILAHQLTQKWYWIVLFWIAVTVALRLVSPRWNDVVKDGDFQFLPADSPSRVGLQNLRLAFPDDLSRSQLVIVFVNENAEPNLVDRCVMYDVARRLTWLAGKIKLDRTIASGEKFDPESPSIQRLRHIFDAAVDFDEQWFTSIRQLAGEESALASQRLIEAYRSRLQLAELVKDNELAEDDRQTIEAFAAQVKDKGIDLEELRKTLEPSLEDIWTWLDPVLKKNLGSDEPHIKLAALQLREEFMAVKNLEITDALQTLIADCRSLATLAANNSAAITQEMTINFTGPAAVGADLLSAAKFSVSQSEVYTIFAVVVTLLLIYRSPLLVLLPLITIGVSLSIASNILSICAKLSATYLQTPIVELYSTTRIFLVVLIFGIGTDLTLFVIVRCRENYFANRQVKPWKGVVSKSWSQVFGAIVGSGLTTAIGLSMMSASSFAKFRYSGVAISISILLTLVVCVTLPAAILIALGPKAFWPQQRSPKSNAPSKQHALSNRMWVKLADLILARPFTVLTVTVFAFAVPATYGWLMMEKVTYNLVGELSSNATSRRGQQLVERYLPGTETSAITLCVTANTPFENDAELRKGIEKYRKELFVKGVHAVQALTDPLGKFAPGRTMSLLSQEAWERRLLQNHPLTQQKFVSRVRNLDHQVARFEIVTDADPFSDEAATVLQRVQERALQLRENSSSPWHKSNATASGTTASIVDLRRITQRDEKVVQVLVTVSVLCVLLFLIRRIELSIYLMLSVLFSYFATLGTCQALFHAMYGSTYEGLDWKVPLFLFVILVAVGQDYNIYLTTRIQEEQQHLGMREGLHHALVVTGGIITSCGLIMFATFAAMCWGSIRLQTGMVNSLGWPIPALRGIGELGFALCFGILLDTFVIRTIVVPAYISWRKLR